MHRLISAVSLLAFTIGCVPAQSQQLDLDPQKGIVPGLSYATSQTETISTGNGNLSLRIPIVTLPADRGGQAASLNLIYNSKVWEQSASVSNDPNNTGIGSCSPVSTYVLNPSDDGGWRYGASYILRVLRRSDHYNSPQNDPCAPVCTASITPTATENFQYQMLFPDGSIHTLVPVGGITHDFTYYNIAPDGTTAVCGANSFGGYNLSYNAPTGTNINFYTIDGTFVRVQAPFNNFSASTIYNWTMSFTDGRRVADLTSSLGVQRIYSRQGVSGGFYIEIGFYTDSNSIEWSYIKDSANRTIQWTSGTYTYNSNSQLTGWTDTLEATGYGGNTITWTVTWALFQSSQTYQTYDTYPSTPAPPNLTLPPIWTVTKIQFPTQTDSPPYMFGYGTSSNTGELRTTGLPSGASVSYQYLLDTQLSPGLIYSVFANNTVRYKMLTHDNEPGGTATDTWTYAIGTPPGHGATITGPDGGVTSESQNLGGYAFKTVYPDGSEVDRTWNQNDPTNPAGGSQPTIPRTSTDPGPPQPPLVNPFVSMEFRSVADNTGSPAKTAIRAYAIDYDGNPIEEDEYSWVAYSSLISSNGQLALPSSAILERTSKTAYAAPSFSLNINACQQGWYCDPAAAQTLSLPQAKEIVGGSRTEYCYDSSSTTGNLTIQAKWNNTAGGSSSSSIVTSCSSNTLSGSAIETLFATYDGYGNALSKRDANNNTTSYTYGNVGGQTGLYPTLTTLPDATSIQRTYDIFTGVVSSETDPAGAITNVFFDDFGRTTEIDATERTTKLAYSDLNRYVISRSDLVSATDQALIFVKRFDQLGRVRLTQQLEVKNTGVPAETEGILTQSQYSIAAGTNCQFTSMPFRATPLPNDPPQAWTRSVSDEVGRTVEVQTFTGGSAPSCVIGGTGGFGALITSYSADTTTVTDEAGIVRASQVDALGRLIAVTENPGGKSCGTAPSLVDCITTYAYDLLDDLQSVSQNGQTRSFAYDSLKRLSSASNPENGLICYGLVSGGLCTPSYDGSGNLLNRTDARGVIATMQYDNMNRMVAKQYTIPSGAASTTPNVTYCYGQPNPSTGCPTGIAYSGGRLTRVNSSASTTDFTAYNAHGQPLSSKQTTGGTPYAFGYTYNLVGSLSSITYPSQRMVAYSFDGAGRVSAVSGVSGPPSSTSANYTQAGTTVAYAPQGAVSSVTLGNALVETAQFNAKLQPTQIQAGSLLTLGYTYSTTNNNGNVISQSISRPSLGFSATQNYTGYDWANRLLSTTEFGSASWSESEGYDSFGNRWISGYSSSLPSLSLETATAPSWYNAANNRVNSWSYDLAGNITSVYPMQRTFNYDAENRQTTATINSTPTTYTYDGDGRRVTKRLSTGAITTYVYDAIGQLAAEYGGTAIGSGTTYLTSDHLGSTRLITSSTGAILNCYDYFPFGGDLPAGVNGRPTSCYPANPNPADGETLKFTSKERDAETGLDFFGERYFSSAQGRFTSPDAMLAKREWLADPQRWNKYAYVRNNPLRYVDPNGEDLIVYTFYGNDLTDEQKKYLQANMKQIQAAITAKFKTAGVDNVQVRDGSQLTQKQIDKILQNGSNTSTTGVGLLNFVNKSYSGYTATDSDVKGATATDSRSAVFLGNLQTGLNLQDANDANTMNFRLGEVGAHELGHGQSFESDGATWNFMKSIFGQGNLMGEGQGTPTRPKQFDPSQDKTQRAIKEINRIGDNTPPKQ